MKYERMFGREYAVRPLGENEFAATWEWKRPHVRYVAVDLGKKEVIYLGHAWRKELRERAKIVAKREFKEFFEKAYDEGIDPKMEEDPFKLDPLAQFVIESDLFGKMTTSEFRELYEEFCEREKRDEEENKVAEEILEENPDLVDCEFPGYYDPNKFGDLIDNKIDEIDEEVGFKTGAWPVNVYFKLKKMAEKKKKEGANDA